MKGEKKQREKPGRKRKSPSPTLGMSDIDLIYSANIKCARPIRLEYDLMEFKLNSYKKTKYGCKCSEEKLWQHISQRLVVYMAGVLPPRPAVSLRLVQRALNKT